MDKAYIYAAGRGIRLGEGFSDLQKIMIEVGGKTLLEWHAIRLSNAGISQVMVITGHKAHLITDACNAVNKQYPIHFQTVYNPCFEEGSALSMLVSIDDILQQKKDVLLMDGDVLYPDSFIQTLKHSQHMSCLLIDQDYSTTDDDPVLVPIKEGRPFEFRKKWTGEAEQVGESIGFFKVNPNHFDILKEETRDRNKGQKRSEPYEEIIRALVLRDCFGFEDVTGSPWTEVDFPEDVDYARDTIFPQLQVKP